MLAEGISIRVCINMFIALANWLLVFVSKTVLFCYLKEYPGKTYPPWAHGPGYVVSNDIAKAVNTKHKEGRLQVSLLQISLQSPLYSAIFLLPQNFVNVKLVYS